MTDRRATIIYNPMSGRAGRREAEVREMIKLLESRGIQAQQAATSGPADATNIARTAIDRGADSIICYGGDGTINEVLQALARTKARLAVWAGGTSNVIARDLGMPFDKKGLADVVAAGKSVRVALGIATHCGKSTESERPPTNGLLPRYFMMMAGIGLDASIARGVNPRLKRRTGEAAYWLSGLRHLLLWKPERFTINVDGRSFESVFTVIGKGKGYGGEMMMTPGAGLTEPSFEVFIVPPLKNNLAYLRVLRACLRGTPEQSCATILRADRVHANSTLQPWVEVDGELIGRLPMDFEVVPDALSIIVP
jgi:YegS/Rv2252/BmrU family lipid kinase